MTEQKYFEVLQRLLLQEQTLERVYGAGLLEHVSQVCVHSKGVDIHMVGGKIEARRAAMVGEFGPDKLDDYYLASGQLAVSYVHSDNVRAIYYDENAEERLASLSDGKCHITREAVESIAEQIICARPE